MRLVNQPSGSNICGQCVVAMLTDKPLAEILAVMGDFRTYPGELVVACEWFGKVIPSRGRMSSVFAPLGKGAAFVWGSVTHWVAYDDCKWYDPASPTLLTTLEKYSPCTIGLFPLLKD